MPDLIYRYEFWVAMMFAVIIKLRSSPTITRTGAILTTVAAVSGALVFTDPMAEYFAFSGESTKFAIAAVVALSCEHVARILIQMTPADALKLWRGK